MNKELFLRLEQEFQYAVDHTIEEFEEYGLRVIVKLVENDAINAGVRKVSIIDNTYEVQINTGVIESLKEALDNIYLIAVNEEDFLQYQFESTDALHRHYDNNTAKNSFMDILVRFISFNILFHECGHILLGHCDGRLMEETERNNSSSRYGGYGLQAREMMADWYGTKLAMNVLHFSFPKECGYSIQNIHDMLLLRKVLLLALLALYCQYNLFESVRTGYKDEFSERMLQQRTHPHPYIRLLYGCDIIKETIMDVLEHKNNINSLQSEWFTNEMVKSIVDDLLMLIKKMGLNGTDGDIFKRELIECYILIRKKAASKKHSTNPYINIQMQKMPKEYLESLRSIYKR